MMKPSSPAAAINALILDIDGTLLWGNTPIPGILALFECLQTAHTPFVIASNNATKSPADYQTKLATHGVNIDTAAILTAGTATATWLQRELMPGAALYVIGETALRQALRAAGFVLQQDAAEPVDAVVVGGDATLTYEKLKHAALLLQRGARFVGTNPDVVYPTEEGLIPEAGTTLAALQAATGVSPTIIGKPERHLFDLALARLGRRPAETAVVGDRLETDIRGGQRAGLKTILTTTGVDNEKSIVEKGIEPDWVVSGPDQLVNFLRGEHGWTHAD
jgi:4-nitrophenyl phosphatase